MELFHFFLEPMAAGDYYCIGAEIVEEEGKVIAMFNMGEARLHKTDPGTVERLTKPSKKMQYSKKREIGGR